jgi:chitinase
MCDTPIYFYLWAIGNTTNYATSTLVDAYHKSGLNSVTLAFVIGDSTGKPNTWVQDNKDDINAFIKLGGKVGVSLGGSSSPDLATLLTAQQIYEYMDATMQLLPDIKNWDWDIEGAEVAGQNNEKRAQAICLFQQKYPNVEFSLTLPSIGPAEWYPGGLDASGINCLKLFISKGVNVTVLRLMVMDNYQGTPTPNWGTVAILTMEAAYKQLQLVYPNETSNVIYKKLMPIFMCGVNDDSTIFSLDDATILTNYVVEKQLAGISYWAFQRDQSSKQSLPISSMITQNNFDFWNIIKKAQSTPIQTVTPVTPSPVTPTPAPVQVVTPAPVQVVTPAPVQVVTPAPVTPAPVTVVPIQTASTWVIRKNYVVGDIVVYNKKTYKCVSSHTSIESWSPSIYTQSLWVVVSNVETVENTTPLKKYIILDSGSVNNNKVVGNIQSLIPNSTQNYMTQLIFEIPNDITQIQMDVPINIIMTRKYL